MPNLHNFQTLPFPQALKGFFEDLKIPINALSEAPINDPEILEEFYKRVNPDFIDNVYALGIVNDAAFKQLPTFDSLDQIREIKQEYYGLLIFGVTLKSRPDGLLPTRSQLTDITRTLNRMYPQMPVTVIFKYGHYLSLANAERVKYDQQWRLGEKVGKVSLLRDIDFTNLHAGHERILRELAISRTGKNAVNTFDELYKYWQSVLSVSILNKTFYNELQNWYFWAVKEVRFPNAPTQGDFATSTELTEALKEHHGKNVIRLLTRILFIWFIKEKGLIPSEIFDEKTVSDQFLKEFEAQKQTGLFATGKPSSKYYQAILQNLFFATLNQSCGKRAFRNEGQHQNVSQLMRYKSYFKDPARFVALMEKTVPFMNGGLFECLDKSHPTDKGRQGGDQIVYVDGFSDRADNELVVPDYLFFDADEDVDLSAELGDKHKKTKTRGLIAILNSYKFTITENTPIDEDIALDPELLGKVFENLLASYNPETKTTARKQTGSFYTPREIVDYMVDESLIAYLENCLNKSPLTPDGGSAAASFSSPASPTPSPSATASAPIEKGVMVAAALPPSGVRGLVSYNPTNPFADDAATQKKIIEALDSCKILDPACGSGAYPMGILQKMVHILHKIDPNNTEWKNRQIQRVNNAIAELEKLDDSTFRDNSVRDLEAQLVDIEESFTNNNLDYGRKLYLIENCIFGVDIQAIATQISKLRFFISLVVDQKVDATKENFGIRPLPNLETKFVAANTLIGIDKPKKQGDFVGTLFDSKEVKDLEDKLKKVRQRLFSAKTPTTKRTLRDQDKTLRESMGGLLADEYGNATARQLANWDPYDQNTSSAFFDKEWMFGISEGFDIVIGNPPWGAKLSESEKDNYKFTYPDIDSSTPNSFSYFIGWAVKNSRVISYILPDSILIKDFSKTRNLIKNKIAEIIWYENSGIPEEYRTFVHVSHDVCILNMSNENINDLRYVLNQYDSDKRKMVKNEYSAKKELIVHKEFGFVFNLKAQDVDFQILEKLKKFDEISIYLQCHEGIHTGNSREILFKNKEIGSDCKPLFYGGGAGDVINNYLSNTSGWFVDYRTDLIDKKKGFYASLRDERIFKLPKIYISRTGNPFKVFYDEHTYASNNFFSLQNIDYNKNTPEFLKYVLPFIVSKVAQYFIRTFAAPRLGSTFIETKIYHLLKFRVPISQISPEAQQPLITLVDKILAGKKAGENTAAWEAEIDVMVYKRYDLTHAEVLAIDPGFGMSAGEYGVFTF